MSEVSYNQKDRIAYICLKASSRGNSFNQPMRKGLNEALRLYRDDEEAWMAVIHADGQNFCEGTLDDDPSGEWDVRERFSFWAGGYVETWKPIIAAVQGVCRGEGFALALGCDLRVATEDASFDASFNQGPYDPNVGAYWLINHVGISAALGILWQGKSLNSREAARMGLVNRIVVSGEMVAGASDREEGRLPMLPMKQEITVPNGEVLAGAVELAKELLQYAPVTRRFQKETAYRSVGVPLSYAHTLQLGPNPYASEDRIEGGRAFVENRRPIWRNR